MEIQVIRARAGPNFYLKGDRILGYILLSYQGLEGSNKVIIGI